MKKKIVLYAAALTVLLVGFKYKLSRNNLEQDIKTITEKIVNDDYLIAAHRGFSSLAVENTKEAILAASDKEYIDFIEIDARMTKDGEIVLSHDNVLNGGIISELTYEEIKDGTFLYNTGFFGQNTIGSKESELVKKRSMLLNGRKYKVISLQEGLDYCKDKLVLLDLKFENDIEEFTKKLTEELESVDTSNIIFQSINVEGIKYFQEHTNFNCQVLISFASQLPYVEYFKNVGFSYSLVNYDLIHSLLKQNKNVAIWTVNSTNVLNGLISELKEHYKDVTYITNYPDLIVTLLEQKKVSK